MHDTITDNRKNDMINGKTGKLIYDKPKRSPYNIIEITLYIIEFIQDRIGLKYNRN